MKKYLGIVLASILGLQGCGEENVQKQSPTTDKGESTLQSPTEVAENKTANDNADVTSDGYKPALWKIEHKGTTSYLFGSIHMGEESMYPLPQTVSQAFDASDTLAVEIDLSNMNQLEVAQKVQKLAIDRENPLETVLTEETLAEYKEYCEETQSPCQMFSFFEPWFAAMTLEALGFQKAGYNEKLGIDMHFLEQARDSKEIYELESIDAQLKIFDELPLKLQDMFLYTVVTKEGDEMPELMQAWKTGNVEVFIEDAKEDAKEKDVDEADYEHFMDIFLYERNRNMADSLATQMEQGKAIFAVVGAAHYAGDKSVNHYLEEKGFTVERVEY